MSAAVGRNVRRSDGEAKVRGSAEYGFDVEAPRMLHARLLRSPVPSGSIARLDTAAASALPGVRAIVTAADVPAVLGGWLTKDQTMFAVGDVRYEGEPIAAIAADTPAAAEAALAAIVLEIDAVEPVTDLQAALEDGARHVHPAADTFTSPDGRLPHGNLAWQARTVRGDAEAALAGAHLVLEDEFRVPRQHQSPIEPHAVLASVEDGRYVVRTSTQSPFLVRDRVAELLGIAASAVRVIATTVGGAFGGKIDALLEPYACVLAQRTGRPVRLVSTRREELLTAGPRENAIIHLRTGFAADGTILGQTARAWVDSGAHTGETAVCATLIPLVLGGAYRVPACDYAVDVVYTNTPPTAAFRGVCAPYTVFALEQHLDHAARRLGLDRRELRLRNVLVAGDAMVNGQVLEDAALLEAFGRAEELAPWGELQAAGRPLRGTAIVPLVWPTNPGAAGATVKLAEDGTVAVVSGGTEIGSGAMATGVRQIVADAVGVDVEDVRVTAPDTDVAAYDAGAQGAHTTFAVGRAAGAAGEKVRERIAEVAADLLEAAPEDLRVADGRVTVAGTDRHVTVAAVAEHALASTGPISETGSHVGPPIPYDAGCMTNVLFAHLNAPSYHVHLCELEIDPDTGRVEILRYVVVQDVGRAVNPQMIAGQIHGAVLQGVGYALFEELRLEDGVGVDDSLERYRLPTAADAPPIEIALMEIPCPYGPYGAKGAAEAPIVPVAAVITCAIADALGETVHELPATPFAVLGALRASAGQRA